MPIKDRNPHPEHHARYFLSLDPRLEEGWVYKGELRTGGRFDLINELGPSERPVAEGAAPGDYKLVELPQELYDRVVELRASGWDDAISEAEGLIRPYMKQGRNDGMYMMERIEGADPVLMKATMREPFGPGWTTEDAEQGDVMEIWGTQFSHEGEDFVEFRLMKDGQVVKSRRVEGY